MNIGGPELIILLIVVAPVIAALVFLIGLMTRPKCPMCKSAVPRGAQICRACQHPLTA